MLFSFFKFLKLPNLLLIVFLVYSCKSNFLKKAIPSPSKFNYHITPEIYEPYMPDSLKYLIPLFDTILCGDQKYRETNNINLLLQNAKEQNSLDSVNQIEVEKLLLKYGLLGKKQFGLKGNLAIRNVLQHAPLKMQQKYLPMVHEAFLKNNVTGDFVAMFEDRINVRNNQPQKYGSQLMYYKEKYVLYPVINIDSINIWRTQMHLISIEDYFKMFKTDFTIKNYKNQLPELIDFFKVKINT